METPLCKIAMCICRIDILFTGKIWENFQIYKTDGDTNSPEDGFIYAYIIQQVLHTYFFSSSLKQ